jgi:Tetratricopeptide repeat
MRVMLFCLPQMHTNLELNHCLEIRFRRWRCLADCRPLVDRLSGGQSKLSFLTRSNDLTAFLTSLLASVFICANSCSAQNVHGDSGTYVGPEDSIPTRKNMIEISKVLGKSRVRVLMREKKYADVVRLASRVLKKWPDQSNFRFLRARALWRLGRVAEAEIDYKQLLVGAELRQGDWLIAKDLAEMYLENHRYAEALKVASRCEAFAFPDGKSAMHCVSAKIFAAMHNIPQAESCLQQAKILLRQDDKMLVEAETYVKHIESELENTK